MAARTVTPTISATVHGVNIGGTEPTITYEGGFSVQLTVPANSINFEITFPHTVVNAVIQGITTNKNCTIKTNDITTPGQTLTMLANKRKFWSSGDPTGNKVFSVNVIKLFVTTGSEATDIVCACGEDVTP